MIKKPLYLGSWKGKVLEAIIIHQAKTWVDIQHYTELSESNLNTALHELQSLKHVVKKASHLKVKTALFNFFFLYHLKLHGT